MIEWTYPSQMSAYRVANSYWNPENSRLKVNANDPDNQNSNQGVRLSRPVSIIPSIF